MKSTSDRSNEYANEDYIKNADLIDDPDCYCSLSCDVLEQLLASEH